MPRILVGQSDSLDIWENMATQLQGGAGGPGCFLPTLSAGKVGALSTTCLVMESSNRRIMGQTRPNFGHLSGCAPSTKRVRCGCPGGNRTPTAARLRASDGGSLLRIPDERITTRRGSMI